MYEQLHGGLCEKCTDLSPRKGSLVFAIAAYRLSCLYEKYASETNAGGFAEIMAILDEIFDAGVENRRITNATVEARREVLLALTPHSEDGFVAAKVMFLSSLIDVAYVRLDSSEEAHDPSWPDDAVYCYLAPWIHLIGAEFFDCIVPGNTNPEFTKLFYARVLADARMICMVQSMERDIDALQNCENDVARTALELRTKARTLASEVINKFQWH